MLDPLLFPSDLERRFANRPVRFVVYMSMAQQWLEQWPELCHAVRFCASFYTFLPSVAMVDACLAVVEMLLSLSLCLRSVECSEPRGEINPAKANRLARTLYSGCIVPVNLPQVGGFAARR